MKKRVVEKRFEDFKVRFDLIAQAHGFKNKKMIWFHDGQETKLFLTFQKSQWGNQIYINTEIQLKGIDSKKDEVHLSARYEMLLGDDSLPPVIDFESSKMNYEPIYEAIEQRIIPLMLTFHSMSKLKEFVNKYNRKRIVATKKAVDLLNLQS